MISPAFRHWHTRRSYDYARRALTEDLRVHPIPAAAFGRGALSDAKPKSFEIDTWSGTEGVQLRIKDVRPPQCGDVVSC
jgi:hypothetical protein